ERLRGLSYPTRGDPFRRGPAHLADRAPRSGLPCRYRNFRSRRLIASAVAAEPAPQTIPTARNAGEQDEDRRDDPDDRRKAERDADGPYKGRDEHSDQDADHLSDSFPWFCGPYSPGPDVPIQVGYTWRDENDRL